MANFGPLTLTKLGRKVQAQAQTGQLLSFTRVSAGDGTIPSPEVIPDMTDLTHKVADLPQQSNSIIGDGTTRIDAILSNKDLATGYFFREVGLFAIDNDTGLEIMYAYANAGDLPDFIPAGGGPHGVNLIVSIVTVIGQAENVVVNITEETAFVTVQEVIEAAGGVKSFIGYDPSTNKLFSIAMDRLIIREIRLRGGTPKTLLGNYQGRISGGTPSMAKTDYDGALSGGTPKLY